MSATNAPFGFICARSTVGGQSFARKFTIASGYAVNLFAGDPVKMIGTTTGEGTIDLATTDGTRTGTVASVPILGIFAGVEYIDSNGKPTVSNFWPASTVATSIVAYVYEGDANEFVVQGDGAIAALDVGTQADWTGFAAPGGSTATGRSLATLSATPIADDAQGAFNILEIEGSPDNTAGDAFTKVIVRIANPQMGRAPRTAQNAAGT
jgi:hypothetical protein